MKDLELKNKSNLDLSASSLWIEFNISGTPEKIKHWAASSKYLEIYVFDLFIDIFDKNTDDNSYYGPTKYKTEQVVLIKNDFEKRAQELAKLLTIDDLTEFFNNTCNESSISMAILDAVKNNIIEFEQMVLDLKSLVNDLTAFLAKCITENRTLWILGI